MQNMNLVIKLAIVISIVVVTSGLLTISSDIPNENILEEANQNHQGISNKNINTDDNSQDQEPCCKEAENDENDKNGEFSESGEYGENNEDNEERITIDGLHYCDTYARDANFTDDVNVVCAYLDQYSWECLLDSECLLCSVSTKNPYYACQDELTLYWTPGQCENDSWGTIPCTLDDRLDNCEIPAEPSEVCGRLVTKEWEEWGVLGRESDFRNKCAACHNSSVFSYFPGQCSLSWTYISCSENTQENTPATDCYLSLDPVCRGPEQGITESFANHCFACSKPTLPKYLAEGICIYHPFISCENHRSSPPCPHGVAVCGYFDNECNDTSCRKSFDSFCTACNDHHIISFQPGVCPQDLGVYCEEGNRPTSCPDPFFPDDRVCGTTSGGVQVTFENSCLACASSSIVFFNPGVCPDQRRFCNETNSTNRDEVSPVCVLAPNCSQDACSQTYPNAYSACKEYPEAFFAPGACEDLRLYCDWCEDYNADSGLGCVFYTDGCDQDICSNTLTNICQSCEGSVLYWKPGKCEIESKGRIVVDLNHRPDNCSADDHNPVCAYTFDCEFNPPFMDNCATNFPNECAARRDKNVLSFYHGRCLRNCEGQWVGCDLSPVCALHSYPNPCRACYSGNVLNYYDGLCPGDEVITCSSDDQEFCNDDFIGADTIGTACGRIGESQECANDTSNADCWKTFDTFCLACSNGASVYKPGQCN